MRPQATGGVQRRPIILSHAADGRATPRTKHANSGQTYGWMDGWMDGVAVPAISNKMTPIKFRHKKANEGRRMYQQQCSAGHAAAIFTS